MSDLLPALLLLLGGLALCGAPVLARQAADRRVRRRLARLLPDQVPPPSASAMLRERSLAALLGLGTAILGRGDATRKLADQLSLAGWQDHRAAPLFAAGRAVLALLAALAAMPMAPAGEAARAAALAGLVAYLAPPMVLSRLAAARARRMRSELPIALDLLVMVLEGGTGVEQALRFSASLPLHPAQQVQRVLRGIVQDLDRGTPYELCLHRLGERLGIEDGRAVIEVLRQSLLFGTELAAPLRALAEDLRQRRLADARASVGKATTAMTVVMVVFLLPALMVLIGAPALSGIFETLGGIR